MQDEEMKIDVGETDEQEQEIDLDAAPQEEQPEEKPEVEVTDKPAEPVKAEEATEQTSEMENYRPGMTISQKSDDLLTRMTGDVEGDLDALYNYPDHRVIAFVIKDQRDFLDNESSKEEVEFWTETMDTEFVEPYKQALLETVREAGEPMVKAALVDMPRDK